MFSKKNALRYELPLPDVNFLCSLKLSEAFFPTIPSCNLKNLARTLDFELEHHNSLSDAEVALQVLQHIVGVLHANGKTLESYMEQRGMEFGRLEEGVLKHFSSKGAKAYRLPFPQGEEAFAFSGKSFVFAGLFTYWNKRQCEQMVIERDGIIKSRMSNLVDYFVVGGPGFFVLQEDFDERVSKAKLLEVNGGRMKVITEEEWVEMMTTVLREGKLR